MAWTYSGDPSLSELDRYRFLIGDTDAGEPLIQDEEIAFILANEIDEKTRLAQLFECLVLVFSRMPSSRSLGPQAESYKERLEWFKERFKYYQNSSTQMAVPIMTPPHEKCFDIGMNDNIGVTYDLDGEDDV